MSSPSSPHSDPHGTPTPSAITALVFMNGRNCAAYVEDAIVSVARQSLSRVHVLFVDDASTDHTAECARASLQAHMPGRHTFRSNATRLGKAGNAGTHLRELAPKATFVAIVDADDQLAEANVLEVLAERYAMGYDVVWTNFVTDQGHVGISRALNAFASPREQAWVTSHLFSFRSLLWEGVPDSYLQDEDGRWVPSAADIAIAYPVLDQTRRYSFVPIPGYRYTDTNPASHHNRDPESGPGLSSREQVHNATNLIARPPLECWRFPSDIPGLSV